MAKHHPKVLLFDLGGGLVDNEIFDGRLMLLPTPSTDSERVVGG